MIIFDQFHSCIWSTKKSDCEKKSTKVLFSPRKIELHQSAMPWSVGEHVGYYP